MKMKTLRLFFPVLLISALFSGCILAHTAREQSSIVLYLPNTQNAENMPNAVFAEVRRAVPAGQEEFVAAIAALTESASAFFGDAKIVSASLSSGRATIDMSPEYQKLSQADKTLINLSTALTLTRLHSVIYVDIWCDGALCAQNLSVYSAVFEDSALVDTQRFAELFLPGDGALFCETVELTASHGSSLEEVIANQILARLSITEHFSISPQTRVVSVDVSDGHCVLNLSEEFFATEPSDHEGARQLIYSFVNSLCALPGIESVTIAVSGRAISSYGSFNTAWPMEYTDTIILW